MTLIITAAEVSSVLALSVNDSDVEQAQSCVELVTGAVLGDAEAFARLTDADRYVLRQAVLWQVAYLDKHPEVLTQVGNLKSAASNGTSVTFADNGGDGLLGPLVERALRRLSWRQGPIAVTTIHPTRRDAEVRPDPWHVVSRYGRL